MRLAVACRSSLAATTLAIACAQPLNSTVTADTGGESNGGAGGSVSGAGAGGSNVPSAGSPSEGGNDGPATAANGGMDELGGQSESESESAGADDTAMGGAGGSTAGAAGSVTAGTAGAIAGSGGTVATGGAASGAAGAGGAASGGGHAGGGAAATGGAAGAGCTLSVTYEETRQANDQPLATFTLTNNGAAFPLNQLGLRYYFNSELNASAIWTATISIQQFSNPGGTVATGGSAVVVQNPAAPQGNDSTAVVSFTSTEVFSPARVLTLQFYLLPNSFAVPPDQSNDWSFVQGHTGPWDPPKITLSFNGVKLCGLAP